jgi:hypothetical protein
VPDQADFFIHGCSGTYLYMPVIPLFFPTLRSDMSINGN